MKGKKRGIPMDCFCRRLPTIKSWLEWTAKWLKNADVMAKILCYTVNCKAKAYGMVKTIPGA